jgi:sulfite reductase (NADPH) flavoprotein alpha-component
LPSRSATLSLRYLFPLACLLLAISLLRWQPPREVSAALVVLAYLVLCLLAWRPGRAAALEQSETPHLLIAYASQSGHAQAIAERSAAQLREAGMSIALTPLNELDPATLPVARRALFIASTYGEGEPPDNGARFERRLQDSRADLGALEYAVLALGDSRYRHFCGFARRLDTALRARQASPLFDRLEIDRGDPGLLRHWQQQLGQLSGRSDFTDWHPAAYEAWRLAGRQLLNPASSGAPLFHIVLQRADGQARWRAGDIAEIGPQHCSAELAARLQRLGLEPLREIAGQSLVGVLATRRLPDERTLTALDDDALLALPRLPHREYSIASVPANGSLQLLVREARGPGGSLGLGSGWLCRHAPTDAPIELRIRSNLSFHGPDSTTPLILIGSGSGLAGLLAHLRERAETGGSRNWLLFGERSAAHDALFRSQMQEWLASGHLQRLELAFSRDQAEKRYVQHLLRDAADELRRWVDEGAAIYVCGSLAGMGREVQQILLGLLGEGLLEQLTAQGRYRRDLY